MQEVRMTGNKNGAVNDVNARGLVGWLPELTVPNAARMVGIGLSLMFVFAIFAEFVAFSELLVPDDGDASVANIEANMGLFGIGLAAYVVVLVMDLLVSWGLYVVLRPVSRDLALLMAGLRVVYTAAMFVALGAMALVHPHMFIYGQLVAYVFFIAHLAVLGYLVYVSGFIHRFFGAFIIVATFSVTVLTYGEYVLPQGLYDAVMPMVMIPAAFAELFLGLWLLVRAKRLPGMIGHRAPSGATTPA